SFPSSDPSKPKSELSSSPSRGTESSQTHTTATSTLERVPRVSIATQTPEFVCPSSHFASNDASSFISCMSSETSYEPSVPLSDAKPSSTGNAPSITNY